MKILLFGPQNAGKTSLMQTTCLGYNFVQVANLKPTRGISRENFIYRGVMQLTIWDAGGQERYMEKYFSDSQRTEIFSEVTTAIFMVDSTIVAPKVREIFEKFLEYIFQFSPEIEKIYVLINKIDLEDSKEDSIYELLTKGINGDLMGRIATTPVSVREGSAQHRLIEILDYELQRNTLSMQKLGKFRQFLDDLKSKTLSEYLLFNLPDGLLITSTFLTYDKFDNKPLNFLRLEMGTLDNSLYQIYQTIMDLLNKTSIASLTLSTVVYESDICYIIIKEVTEGAVLMAITENKKPEVYSGVMSALGNNVFEDLKKFLRSSGY